MKTISENVMNIYEIKKSKFITYIYKVNNLDEVKNLLNNIKIKYNDATHICYAYKVGANIKCTDNNEPSGTAGIPILEILNKNDLDYVLAIVIRYFGGIKLGAGGLVRSYSNSVIECLNKISLVNLVKGFKILIETSYNETKQLEYILKDQKILKKEFNENVKFYIEIKENDLNIINQYNYKILDEILIASK